MFLPKYVGCLYSSNKQFTTDAFKMNNKKHVDKRKYFKLNFGFELSKTLILVEYLILKTLFILCSC